MLLVEEGPNGSHQFNQLRLKEGEYGNLITDTYSAPKSHAGHFQQVCARKMSRVKIKGSSHAHSCTRASPDFHILIDLTTMDT
jgi:hypothetical protein